MMKIEMLEQAKIATIIMSQTMDGAKTIPTSIKQIQGKMKWVDNR